MLAYAIRAHRRTTESGFTLIELLVVILIIGVLAAITVPLFLNQRKTAVDAQTRSDMRNVVSAVESELTSNPNATCVRANTNGNAQNVTIRVFDGGTGMSCTGGTEVEATNAPASDGTMMTLGGSIYSETGYVIRGSNLGGTFSGGSGGAIHYHSNEGGFQN